MKHPALNHRAGAYVALSVPMAFFMGRPLAFLIQPTPAACRNNSEYSFGLIFFNIPCGVYNQVLTSQETICFKPQDMVIGAWHQKGGGYEKDRIG